MSHSGQRPAIRRTVLLALVVTSLVSGVSAQQRILLHIKVVLPNGGGTATPVAHHALLISEDPPFEPPRRVVTGADGTVDVRLPPGAYTIESDQPVAFQGHVYQWTRRLTLTAGDATLELNAQNAEDTAAPSGSNLENDPAFLLNRWDRNIVGVWTSLAHGAGTIVDAANGLVLTNAQLAGSATDIEVQLAPDLKVRARLVAADAARNVAMLQIHPSVTASLQSLSPDCSAIAPIAPEQKLLAIAVPMRGPKDFVTGRAVKAGTTDLLVAADGAGGPVFVEGRLAGMTLPPDASEPDRRWASRVAGLDSVCPVLTTAENKVHDGMPPVATHLPVDPVNNFPADALKAIVARRAGNLRPPQIPAAEFDVALITPVHTYGADSPPVAKTGQRGGPGSQDLGSQAFPAVRDFANWSDYVADYPPVLLVRATPKAAEGFWSLLGRGAAYTQGVALPAIKRVRSGFARMRAFCGDQEVTPIHPFKLEQRVSETDVVYEGLYAFDADAFGPQCMTMTLTLYSDKQPGKGDTRPIDPATIRTIAADFAAYRAASPSPR